MKNLKILHVVPSLADCRGGPSKAVIDMVTALRNSGTNAEVATTNDNGPNTLTVTLNELTDYHGIPVRFFKRFSPPIPAIREFAYSLSFQRWLSKHIEDYDLIHVHAIFSFCSTYAMSLARRNKIPYIVGPIGQLEPWPLRQSRQRKETYLKWFETKNLTGAARVHFTANSEQEFAKQKLPSLNGVVIPLGLDMPMIINNATAKMHKRWNLDHSVPTIIYLSRLHPKKGLEHLLQALADIDNISFQLLIAGAGNPEYQQSLEQKIKQLDLSNHCQFVGHLSGSEKNVALQGADLFALTSHSENFGIAVLEALASGTAALVSHGVALSEQVSTHELGYVCELTNESIQTCLIEALTDIENTQAMGEQARRFAEKNYQWNHIAERFNKLYQECI